MPPKATLPSETIVVIHGTFAEDATWWRRDGEFCRKLDEYLEAADSTARCWAHLQDGESEFVWSGLNSEVARESASLLLAEHVEKIIHSGRFSKIHFICHSHGGNVFLRLKKNLLSLSAAPVVNGSKIFMGTPFYEVLSRKRDSLGPETGDVTCVCLCLLSLGAYYSGYLVPLIVFGILSIVSLLRFMLRPFWSADRFSSLPWNAWSVRDRNAVFSFASDEAALALQTAARFWRDPPEELISQQPRRWEGVLFRRNREAYLGLFLYYARLAPGAPPDLKDEQLSLRSILRLETKAIVDSFKEIHAPGMREVLFNLAALLFLTVMFSLAVWLNIARAIIVIAADWTILALVGWLTPAFRRYAIRRGIRAAAASALGMDTVGWQILSIRRVPSTRWVNDYESIMEETDKVWNLIPIPEDVEQDARNTAIRNMTMASERFYAPSARSSAAISYVTIAEISKIFKDVNLLHNQYYQNEWTISKIAQTISQNTFNNPDWHI